MTRRSSSPLADRLDRWAIWLSAACVAHCVATTLALTTLAVAGGVLGDPVIHEVGLIVAMVLGLLAFGRGIVVHRRPLPLALGAVGLSLMAAAILAPHGDLHIVETVLTVLGVCVLATAHLMNRRAYG